MTTPHLPGRLGDPDMHLATDPRADPRMVEVMRQFEMHVPPPPSPVDASSDMEAIHEVMNATEEGFGAVWAALFADLPPVEGVTSRTEIIPGPDGNDVSLYIHEPAERSGPIPAVVHTHGGGMVLMSATDPGFVRFRNDLAAAGNVVVGVEFRNGGGRLGNHPFPAGLNDCASPVQWTHANRDELGISNIIVSGESGGGNLAIATTLKAKREGWLAQIAGVYAMCPYILGNYADPPAELLSLQENDGYSISCQMMAALVRVYDPTGDYMRDPLAWPYHASVDELAGLPPHVISVNELDPLRDEGLAFFRKLLQADVSAVGRTVGGTQHAGDLMLPDAVPEIYQETVRSVCGFARARSA